MDPLRLIELAALKGGVMATVLAALDVGFIKSLIIAIVSASISGLFLVFANRQLVRHTAPVERKLDDVAGKLGVKPRAGEEDVTDLRK